MNRTRDTDAKTSTSRCADSAMKLRRRDFMKRTIVSAGVGGALAGFAPTFSSARNARGNQRLRKNAGM